MLCRGFFFFDVFVDQAWYAAASETARRFVLGFPFGVAHEAAIKGFFRADKIIVIKRQFAAFTAL